MLDGDVVRCVKHLSNVCDVQRVIDVSQIKHSSNETCSNEPWMKLVMWKSNVWSEACLNNKFLYLRTNFFEALYHGTLKGTRKAYYKYVFPVKRSKILTRKLKHEIQQKIINTSTICLFCW